MWVFLSIISAFFLGIYDVMKKVSLNGNAVLPVLLVSTISGAIIFLVPYLLSVFQVIEQGTLFYVPPISVEEHLLIGLKTVIVVSSWVLSFFALKNLPITIVAPIRSTSPLWTLVGALIIFGEQLNFTQLSGILVTLVFFYLFSTAGKLEGITFRNNKYLWFIIMGTLIASISGLYDKFLLQRVDRMAVQTFFSFYQVVLMAPVVMLFWWPKRHKYTPFTFRWSIPLIGLFLAMADFFYFYALTYPDALISVITALRRASVVVAFAFGAYLFREKNIRKKAYYLIGILAGVMILIFGK